LSLERLKASLTCWNSRIYWLSLL